MNVIQAEDLGKSFKSGWPGKPSICALDGLSFSVKRGEIYGFLGPNGAGKTTTIKILMGLMRADKGRIEILGRPVGDIQVRQQIGFLPESPYFYNYLTANEFLAFYGHLAGMVTRHLPQRVSQLLDLVGLKEVQHRQLQKFSKGMLQRVGLAQAIIHDPELIVLDEPMSGLDPIGRKQVRDLILQLRDEGKTVFFSSHILPDVEMICDQVGIVIKGQLLAAGSVADLVGASGTRSVEIVSEGVMSDRLTAVHQVADRVLQRGSQLLVTLPGSAHVDEVLSAIHTHGGKIISVTPQKNSLEELFLKQTQSPTNGRTSVEA